MQDENYSASIGDLRGMIRHRSDGPREQTSDRTTLQWTQRKSAACTLAAIVFAWGSLHVVLKLIFATSPLHH
ncbi:hypothetical protein [Paraburkholderia sp. MM5384-R2]|uniref:hypothetical protein n=1 Tax=Paraburkholderia sp. MM5384-R2 TaxID=2723097 RepID=UPI0016090CE8|nr:hypothetical protein [Paraburkholderia sp. MM5384-R2]